MKPSTGSIDCRKILKQHLVTTEKATFLNFAIWPNKNGPDKYGNTHYIAQSVSKEARERGERGNIIGNVKLIPETPAPSESTPPDDGPPPF